MSAPTYLRVSTPPFINDPQQSIWLSHRLCVASSCHTMTSCRSFDPPIPPCPLLAVTFKFTWPAAWAQSSPAQPRLSRAWSITNFPTPELSRCGEGAQTFGQVHSDVMALGAFPLNCNATARKGGERRPGALLQWRNYQRLVASATFVTLVVPPLPDLIQPSNLGGQKGRGQQVYTHTPHCSLLSLGVSRNSGNCGEKS